MSLLSLCNRWEFTNSWSQSFLAFEGEGESVRLPHTVCQLPLHYANHMDYQMICGYRRKLYIPAELADKRLFLQFDGAAHISTLFINGKEVASYYDGYTAFRTEITGYVNFGGENQIVLRLDTTENPSIPPFGNVVDYLTYGGLYREAWLDVRSGSFLRDVYVTTPTRQQVRVEATVDNPDVAGAVLVEILEDGKVIASRQQDQGRNVFEVEIPGAHCWSPEDPHLYTCRVKLLEDGGKVLDEQSVRFGVRTAEFKADGFYLNGEKYLIRGLDRHQCYPYIGYAAPASLQREDARILRHELGCNAVRTSHYPQSQHFLDACDEVGLLVFTEIPGWQHIGDKQWQERACDNTRHMVSQYRNHPSIIAWGVRINESKDCDSLYEKTNAIARQLDPSRPTSGVRCIRQSSLLEDVYAFNDFSYLGNNPPLRQKKDVTPDMNKALLITEYGGHMFPTKSYDNWSRRQEHALRHAAVINAAAASGEHAGSFGWCMVDYATHKDFGSGDRVCYHGVMDQFRNPKLAAAVYRSQQSQTPVLELSSSMEIGDYTAAKPELVHVFTNAETVDVYRGGYLVNTIYPNSQWSGLKHPPMVVEDGIGQLLETREGIEPAHAAKIRDMLLQLRQVEIEKASAKDLKKFKSILRAAGLTMEDGEYFYRKYASSWGDSATAWRFDAKNGDQVVASATCAPSTRLHLEVKASHHELREGDTYDMAAIRVRILNEYDNVVPYAQLPVRFQVEGPAQLVGGDVAVAEGGMCGTYLRTTGETGSVRLTISTGQTEPVVVGFFVTK